MCLQMGRQYPTEIRRQEAEEDLGIPTMKNDFYNLIEMQLPGKLKRGAEQLEVKGVEGLSCVHSSMNSNGCNNQKIQWLPDPFLT